MTAQWIQFGIVAALFACGFFVLFVSIFGIYRFRFALNRIHSQALADTMTLFLVLLGCIAAYGVDFASLKLLLVILFMWLTSPISSHMLTKLEYLTDEHLDEHCEIQKISDEGDKE